MMKAQIANSSEQIKICESVERKEKEERLAAASITPEILSQLNVSIDALPHRCQQLLLQVSELQSAMDINQLDPIVISLRQSKEFSEKLEEEYEILKLRQKNEELQMRIDRNNKFIEGLKKELECSRSSLASQNPNPGNIQEVIRQMKMKVASYEESCEKAKTKFSKLSVPDSIYPPALTSLATQLASLQTSVSDVKQRADDVALAKEARLALSRLCR